MMWRFPFWQSGAGNIFSGMKKIAERELVSRINRKLGEQLEKVCISSVKAPRYNELGRHYIVTDGTITAQHVDIVALGRELNCIGANVEVGYE